MIDALVAGRIFGTPEQRTARNGSTYTTAKIRVPMANGEATFVNVIAFRESVITALLALQDGDSAALAGELKAGAYLAKDGMPKPSLDLTVHAVLTEYHVARKRKAVATEPKAARNDSQPRAAGDPDDFHDEIPF